MTTPAEAIASPRPMTRRRGRIAIVRTGLGEMLGRRELTRYLVGAELKRTHADTAIGQLWWVLDPLLQMAVYYIFITIIFASSQPDYPLFIFVAILPWKWFSATLNEATLSITGQAGPHPPGPVPQDRPADGGRHRGHGQLRLRARRTGDRVRLLPDRLSLWILSLPIIAAVQFVFTIGVALIFSAANAFFRDIQNVLRHFLRMWFYLSPVLYSLDRIEKIHPSAAHHPVAQPVRGPAQLLSLGDLRIDRPRTGPGSWSCSGSRSS